MDLIYPAIFGALKGLCTGIAVSFEGTVSVLMHFFSMETPEAGMYSAMACAGIALGLAARYIIRLARGVSGTAVMLSGWPERDSITVRNRLRRRGTASCSWYLHCPL